MVRLIRRLFAEQPLAASIRAETFPGPEVKTPDQIVDAIKRSGTWGYHTVGTCRMGSDPTAVVDPRLRVYGIDGLRVVDASVFPRVISGNTNGPVMAVALRAADLILEDTGKK